MELKRLNHRSNSRNPFLEDLLLMVNAPVKELESEEKKEGEENRERQIAEEKAILMGLGLSENMAEKEAERRYEERTRIIREQRDRFEDILTIDELTGLNNKRGYKREIKSHMQLASRASEKNAQRIRNGETPEPVKLSLLMVDIDKFKYVNDFLGHENGDKILKAFGEVVRETVRTSDYPARIGGEEFVIIYPQTNGEAIIGAERLREAMEIRLKPLLDEIFEEIKTKKSPEELFKIAKEFDLLRDIGVDKYDQLTYGDLNENQKAKLLPIIKTNLLGTISIGVSTHKPGDTEDALLKRADIALYKAKINGRNQVINGNPELSKEGITRVNQETAEIMTKHEIIEKTEELETPESIANQIIQLIAEHPEMEMEILEKAGLKRTA